MALHGPLVRGLCPEVPPPRDRLDRRNSKHRWLPERSPWRRGRGGRVGGRGPLLLLRCCGRGWPRAWPSACFRHAAGRACEERREKNKTQHVIAKAPRPFEPTAPSPDKRIFRHPPVRQIACLCLFCFCAESRSGTRAVEHILGEYGIGRQSPGTISDMLLGRSAIKAPPGFLNIIISGNAGLRAAV